jgi:NTE family protein
MATHKYALVLSGGGFKGAFQLGALKQIFANGIPHHDGVNTNVKFDIVVGVSVGALNGALVAMNKFDVLEQLWDDVAKKGHSEIYTSDILTVTDDPNGTKISPDFGAVLKKILPSSIFGTVLQLIFDRDDVLADIGDNFKKLKGLADNNPLLNKLKKTVSAAEFPSDVIYRCGFVSLTDGKYYALGPEDFDSDKDLQLGIVASTAIPIVWPPVPRIKTKNNGTIKNSSDGGVRNITPLGDVIGLIKQRRQPNEKWHIVVINCNSPQEEPSDIEYGVADVALRAINDIMTNEIFRSDMDEFLRINELVNQVELGKVAGKIAPDFELTDSNGNVLRSFEIKIIEPTQPKDVGDTLDSSRKAIQKRFTAGFLKAQEVLNAPPSLEQPWS